MTVSLRASLRRQHPPLSLSLFSQDKGKGAYKFGNSPVKKAGEKVKLSFDKAAQKDLGTWVAICPSFLWQYMCCRPAVSFFCVWFLLQSPWTEGACDMEKEIWLNLINFIKINF